MASAPRAPRGGNAYGRALRSAESRRDSQCLAENAKAPMLPTGLNGVTWNILPSMSRKISMVVLYSLVKYHATYDQNVP